MADRRVGKHSIDQRGLSNVEFGTCNVCSSPCSSCMHRNVGFAGLKSEESSDENGRGVVAGNSSVITASEASNLVNSNQDALSENGESKETIRCNKDREDSSIEGNNEKDGKDTLDEPIMSENESDDSEMVEHDVKVCDICGDAGREDLLAICTGCSDGAEHTYCMRERLNEVPEGDWLCEECQEAEKQKQEDKKRRETEVTLDIPNSGKRHVDKTEAAPDAKRQAVEGLTGSPKKSILPRVGALSREASFKGLERPKGKLIHQTSFSDDTEGAQSTGSHLQPPKGALLKSSSFNGSSSKPKVQLMDDVIPPRKKTMKEYTPLDVKEGGFRNVGKLMSSRTTDSGSSSPNDPKLTPRGNTRDSKGLQSDGKRGVLTKQLSNLNRMDSINDDYKDEPPTTSCVGEGMPSNGNREFREVGKKCKEGFGKRQRSSLLSGVKGGLASSQKGDQPAEANDTTGTPDSTAPSTTKNVREDINKGNRLRASLDAALRKKPNFGKNRVSEQSDASTVDSSSDKTLRNQLPSTMHNNYVTQEGLQGGYPPPLWPASDPYKQTVLTNDKQTVLSGAAAIPPRFVEPEVNFSFLKPVKRDWPLPTPPALLRNSAIPDHESIWQGDLEVRKTRDESAMHSGMQAHLSTLASPKVAEVVNKFPEKFSLNEVPRLSTWPAQFQDIGTKEDHIALFFFAKDVESYERNYKPLVDTMIKKDLALKGNLDNVELLIFASNQLPPNCQRWNTLYFLWGVFRGRKDISTNPQKETPLISSNTVPRDDQDPNDLPQTSHPPKNVEKVYSRRESSHHNITGTEKSTDVVSHANPSDRASSVERSLSTKEEIACNEDEPGEFHVPCQANGSSSGDSLVKKVEHIEKQELGPLTVTGSDVRFGGQEAQEVKDLNFHPNHRKRPVWELAEPNINHNQKVELINDCSSEESPNKKLKTDNVEESPNESSSVYMKKSPKVVFPLDLNNVEGEDEEDIEMMDDFIQLDKDKRRLSGTVPNLELALGAEDKSQNTAMGLLPFLAGRRTNSGEQTSSSNVMNKDDDVEVSASLSLSLSFPGDESRKNANAPLFLFRDLPR